MSWFEAWPAVDAVEGSGVGDRIVPVERHVGAVACCGAGTEPSPGEFPRHERAGPPSSAEDERGLR